MAISVRLCNYSVLDIQKPQYLFLKLMTSYKSQLERRAVASLSWRIEYRDCTGILAGARVDSALDETAKVDCL